MVEAAGAADIDDLRQLAELLGDPQADIGGAGDDGRIGVLLEEVGDPLDVAGFADAIGRIDLASARALGLAAREAIAPYTPQAMAREYLALYARLLGR